MSDKPEAPEKKHIHRGSNIVIAILIAFVVLIVAGVITVSLYVNNLLGKVNYDEGTISSSDSLATDVYGNIIDSDDLAAGDNTDETEYSKLDDDEAASIASSAEGALDDDPILSADNVINVLLIGSDTREAGTGGRSDTMILASINRTKKQITLTSLMRDMYVNVPGYGNTKLGHANAYGGPALLLDTVKQNFKVDVEDFALVDFYSLADIIDILGGVSIYVEPGEVKYINDSVRGTNASSGRNAPELHESGQVLLTGAQAVGYSRIRYYGAADFGRTERQRTVLTVLLSRFMGASIGELSRVLNAVLPNVTTNLSKSDLLSYVPLLAGASGYDIVQLQIPYEGSFYGANINGLDVLVPDVAANRAKIRETLY